MSAEPHAGFWKGRRTLVTGGASFIGSHLVDRLVEIGARVRVVDNLSTGLLENIAPHLERETIEFIEADLRVEDVAREATLTQSVVFHLAADHGGRGYIATHPVECSVNMVLDGNVFRSCHAARVEKVVYASSGCVYPTSLQMDAAHTTPLQESMVGPPYDADDLYGWAKLMGEFTLHAYHVQYGMPSASCRLFTVYGPRCGESHAVMAMLARGFVRQSPFTVWGTGEQVRNWTYVADVTRGLLLSAERLGNGTAINLGSHEPVTVAECARQVMKLSGYEAPLALRTDMPTGVMNRVADGTKAWDELAWRATVPFHDGLRLTWDWYSTTKERSEVQRIVESDRLLLRHAEGASARSPGT